MATKITEEEKREILELYNSGSTIKEIAELTEKKYDTIWHLIRRNTSPKEPTQKKVSKKEKNTTFDARRKVLLEKETKIVEQAFNIKRGDIYYILKKGSTDGSVIDSGRPAVVVSNDKNNANSDIVEIVYLTTQPKKNMPTHVGIRSSGIYSTAICEQILTVPKERVVKLCGVCTDAEMKAIDAALIASLGLNLDAVTAPTEVNSKSSVVEEEISKDYREVIFEKNMYKKLYEDLLEKVLSR